MYNGQDTGWDENCSELKFILFVCLNFILFIIFISAFVNSNNFGLNRIRNSCFCTSHFMLPFIIYMNQLLHPNLGQLSVTDTFNKEEGKEERSISNVKEIIIGSLTFYYYSYLFIMTGFNRTPWIAQDIKIIPSMLTEVRLNYKRTKKGYPPRPYHVRFMCVFGWVISEHNREMD